MDILLVEHHSHFILGSNVPNTDKTPVDFAFGVHARNYHHVIFAMNITSIILPHLTLMSDREPTRWQHNRIYPPSHKFLHELTIRFAIYKFPYRLRF